MNGKLHFKYTFLSLIKPGVQLKPRIMELFSLLVRTSEDTRALSSSREDSLPTVMNVDELVLDYNDVFFFDWST